MPGSVPELAALMSEPLAYQGRPILRYPCDVRYSTELLQHGELARAMPDSEVRWTRYTIHLHPGLEANPSDALAILAHELGHVLLGPRGSEQDCDRFAETLLGLSEEVLKAVRARNAHLLGGATSG